MKQLSDKQIQEYLVLLLKKYVAFCEKHNLKYYFAYGSLLGAIRHKGFIPWDNDLDVSMPRKDYCRFLSLMDSEDSFQVKCKEKTPGYMYDYAKITDKGTRIETIYMKDIDGLGLFIDVFPMDLVNIDEHDKKVAKMRIVYNRSMMIMGGSKKIRPSKNTLKMFIKRFFYKYAQIKGSEYWLDCKQKMIDSYKEGMKLNYFIVGKDIILSRFYDGDDTTVEFEGLKVNAPHDVHGYLESCYGNYMELPPINQRISSHDFIAYECYASLEI